MIRVIISLTIFVMHVTKIFFFTKLDMLITIIGIITIETGMLGTVFGIEIVMIKRSFSVHSKDQGKQFYKFFISQC